MNDPVLKVENLIKQYGGLIVVNNISFSIGMGEIVGLLGPNGAGKTTTIDMILGVVEPTNGNIFIAGANIAQNRSEILESMNFTAASNSIPGNLSVKENLYIFGMLYGVKDLQARIKAVIKQFDLEKHTNINVGLLSSGEQTRVNLAKAVLNHPKLILLDEPTASLDPHVSMLVREMMIEYAKKNKAAILWTSHNMQEVEAVCDRIFFISHGKIILEGNPRELPSQYNKPNLEELFVSIAKESLAFSSE